MAELIFTVYICEDEQALYTFISRQQWLETHVQLACYLIVDAKEGYGIQKA